MTASFNAVVLVKLTLTRKPEQRDKSTGSGKYTFARGREGSGEGARFYGLFAYQEAARAELDRLDVGDIVTVWGPLDVGLWEGRGKPEISLKVNVDRAVALKPPPRERKAKRKATGEEIAARSWAAPSLQHDGGPSDALPF